MGAQFSISSASITIDVIPQESSQPIQTLTVRFPGASGLRFETPTATQPLIAWNFPKRVTEMQSNRQYSLIRPEDIVLGLEVAGPNTSDEPRADGMAGDMRMIAALRTVGERYFKKHMDWAKVEAGTTKKAHSLITSVGYKYDGAIPGGLAPGVGTPTAGYPDRQPGLSSRIPTATGVKTYNNQAGDFDTGIGVQKDGPYINKPDEGDMQFTAHGGGASRRIPYITKDDHMASYGTVFSPNRQVPSSMMLGSIPTGVKRFRPWETLLFCPHPEDQDQRDGWRNPKDHLIADLFWMPVVEPYAISQPFSTAGKVNLNYQIQPFTYIQRSTGLRAVMKSTKFMALFPQDAATYKPHWWRDPPPTYMSGVRRLSIDPEKTLKDFDEKFADNEIFKSATQICEMNLVPATPRGTFSGSVPADSAGMAAFWRRATLTGDNLREKPYADIYPRLTTKSNAFTVHVRVQVLKKSLATGENVFVDPESDETGPKDAILSEYRGSTTIERYIDPNDPDLPNFAREFGSGANLDDYYKFRVVNTKRFAP
jgi:uncharacterized protein (TIGR02600 family)